MHTNGHVLSTQVMSNSSVPDQGDVPPPLLPRQDDDDETKLDDEYLKRIVFDAMDMLQMNDNVYDPDIVNKLRYPSNSTTQKQYKQYKPQYIDFCRKRKLSSYGHPAQVANFLNDYVKKQECAGSVWTIYACLNNMFQRDYNINLNNDRQLRNFMHTLTKTHIPKKSEIISAEKIRILLTIKLRDSDPNELACKIWTSLVYFGLLRNSETFRIQVKDVAFRDTNTLSVDFPYASKHRENGFSFFIPNYLQGSFTTYMNQISNEEGRLLKNIHNKSKKREQNMGVRRAVSFC